MKIIAYISGYDGCGYYRIQLVAKYLNKYPDIHMKISSEYKKADLDWADLVILQKQVNQKALKFVQYAKQQGKKVITEVDDDYFNIPTWNPAHKHYWNKGQELINFYKMSDAMTVTTPHLAKELSKYNDNVHVAPNSLDIPYLESLEKLDDEEKYKHLRYLNSDKESLDLEKANKMMEGKKIIGWGGSPTHLRDLQQATSALLQICNENKDVMVVMMACATDELLEKMPKDQLLLVNPAPIFLYPKSLMTQNWAVGICPIEDNVFNRSKSNLKYLEFGQRGFACLCSDVENYAKTITDRENGMLTANTDKAWYDSLFELINNEELRDKLGKNAKEFIHEKFNMVENHKVWLELYQSVLGV